MKNKRFTALVLALALVAAGMCAWGVSGQVRINGLNARIAELEAALAAKVDEAAPADSQADSNVIVAEFNGGVITAAEAAEEYALIASYYEMMGMSEAEYAENAKISVLDGLIEEKILEQKAKELGVYDLTDDQRAEIEARVQAEYEDNIAYYMAFRFDDSKTDEQVRQETIDYLAENGYSYESMLQDALQSAWRDNLYNQITGDMTVTEEHLRQFYDSQVESASLSYSASFYAYELDSEGGHTVVWHPEGVRRVQAIQIAFDADQGVEYLSLQAALDGGDSSRLPDLEALYDALEPRAQEALERARAGEDFAALMAEYGASAYTNISEKSTLCGDAFREAALALENPGDISEPVQTDGGICIIQYVQDIPAGAVAYDEVKDELLANYQEELKTSLYNATVVGWIQEANVQYYTDRF